MIYLKLSSDFAEQSEVFNFITISKKIDLDYEMKMMQDFNIESIINITEKMSEYLDFAEKGAINIDVLARKVINEGLNTKS